MNEPRNSGTVTTFQDAQGQRVYVHPETGETVSIRESSWFRSIPAVETEVDLVDLIHPLDAVRSTGLGVPQVESIGS